MNDSLNCGDGWVFCSKAEAEEWYDFYDRRWKLMSVAGRFDYGSAYRKRDRKPKIIKLESIPYGDGYAAYLYWSRYNWSTGRYTSTGKLYRLSSHGIDIIEAVENVLIRFGDEKEREAGSLGGIFEDGVFLLRT